MSDLVKENRILALRTSIIGLSNFIDRRMSQDADARSLVIAARSILDRDEATHGDAHLTKPLVDPLSSGECPECGMAFIRIKAERARLREFIEALDCECDGSPDGPGRCSRCTVLAMNGGPQ